MRLIATDGVAWSVGRSVCLSVCLYNDRERCKNGSTDRDETRWDQETKYVFDGVKIPHGKEHF